MKEVLIAVEEILNGMTLNEAVEERAYAMARKTWRRQDHDLSPEEVAAGAIYLAQITLLEEATREQVTRYGEIDEVEFQIAKDFVAESTGVTRARRSRIERAQAGLQRLWGLITG